MNARKILSSIFFNYLAAITVSLVGFISTPIVLHHLGKAAFGAWALIAAIIGYSSLLDLGVGLTVMRQVAERAHLSDRGELRRITSTALTIYSAAGLVIVVAGVSVAGELGAAFHLHGSLRHDFTIAMILMSVTLGLTFPSGLYTGINQGFGRFRAQSVIVMGQAIVGTIVVVTIAVLGGGLVPLALGWTGCVLLGFAVKVTYAARALGITPSPRRFDRTLARSLMSISFWMFIINLANKVIWNTDAVIVGSVIGAVAVAHYSVALGPATAVRSLTDQFNSVTYTAAASLRAQDQRQSLQRLLLEATRVVASCICPFVVLFLMWGSQFLHLWVGVSFASSAPTLVVLVIGMLSTSVQATATQILLASELQSSIAVVAVLEAVANLVCSIILARSMGIEGVALGTTIPTTITAFGFYLPKAARQLSIPLDRVLRRPIGPVLLSAGTYVIVRFVVPPIRFPSLVVFCAFTAVFVGALVLTGVLLDPEERGTYVGVFFPSHARRATPEGDSKLRARLDDEQLKYVLSVAPTTTVFVAATRFEIPPAKPGAGRPRTVPKPDREHTQVKTLAAALPANAWQTVTYRDHAGEPVRSRFAFERVIAAHPVTEHRLAPREEWLIVEWPEGKNEPTDYWLSNLAADTAPERLARLARLRWMIELDYRQLKGELGLDPIPRS